VPHKDRLKSLRSNRLGTIISSGHRHGTQESTVVIVVFDEQGKQGKGQAIE
jgi:hypothetical protein